jgi:hypothetical protein
MKKGVVNSANNDDKYFQWVILAALHLAKDYVDRISNYKRYESELNLENISFLVQADEIILKRFE